MIADTHLGLKSKKINCEPDRLKEFLDWIRENESKRREISIESRFEPDLKKRIFPPNHLLILGDAVELWDASDRSIHLCSKTISEDINHLKSKITYLTGNHDYLLRNNSGIYPLSNSELEILPDTYPIQKNNDKIHTLKIGDYDYLFLHGHQFDKSFRKLGSAAMLMAYIRDGAEALGAYSWIALIFFFIFLMGYLITKFVPIPSSFVIDFVLFRWKADITLIKNSFLWGMLTTVLGIFSIPRGLLSIARPIWNRIRKTRYNRKKALNGFLDWWTSYSKNKKCDAKMLNIVYGHTHILDLIPLRQAYAITKRAIKEVKPPVDINLINIPSWVDDTSLDILKDIALYIDKDGFEFVGWDSERKKPFIFSKLTIEKMVYYEPLDKEEEQIVEKFIQTHN